MVTVTSLEVYQEKEVALDTDRPGREVSTDTPSRTGWQRSAAMAVTGRQAGRGSRKRERGTKNSER